MKAFIVASSLSLASAAAAFAATPASASTITYSPIALGPQAGWALSSIYVNPPTGAVTLGGIPFNTGNFALLTPGQSISIPTSIQNPSAAYLLLNSGNTWMFTSGWTAGRVRLSFSDGTFQDTNLIVGSNIREWSPGGATVGTLTSPSASNVWSGSGTIIDMLKITILPTAATLTGVTVSNLAPSTLNIQLNGLTIADPPAAVTTPGKGDDDEDENDDNDGDHAAPAAGMNHPAAEQEKHEARAVEKHDGALKPKAQHDDADRDGAHPKDNKNGETERSDD